MNFYTQVAITTLTVLTISCSGKKADSTEQSAPVEIEYNGRELIQEMVEKVGTYRDLWKKKNVIYTYTYTTPDGRTDRSTEKYLFQGELSYGQYHRHERTLPELEGTIEQGYDGDEYWLKNDGNIVDDEKLLDGVKFNRPTNYYWFTMMQKLLDPGLNYEYLGETKINESEYHIVKITFNQVGDKPTDIYQLYLNKETSIADQFLFTVADKGLMETPLLMTMEYEEIDGMLIPTKRRYKKSTWSADVTDAPWIEVEWSDIQFNNDLSAEDFRKN